MSALRLRPVKHGKSGDANRYCGPAVLSALTGMTTGRAAALIRLFSGKRKVTGTTDTHLRAALTRCGIRSIPIHVPTFKVADAKWSTGYRVEKPTLAAWLHDNARIRTAGRVYLVSAGKHWQAISGRSFVCGLTGDVVPLTHPKVRRRAKVRAVWELTRIEQPA